MYVSNFSVTTSYREYSCREDCHNIQNSPTQAATRLDSSRLKVVILFHFWGIFSKILKVDIHDFLIKLRLISWYIDFVMTTYILNVHVCRIELIIWERNERLSCYTCVKAMYQHQYKLSYLQFRVKKLEIAFIVSLYKARGPR